MRFLFTKRKKLEKRIIEFAIDNKEIWGVSRGRDFEEDVEAYYLLTKVQLPNQLEDKIPKLTISLYKETGLYYDIWQWEVTPDNISNYPPLGRIIFSKNI